MCPSADTAQKLIRILTCRRSSTPDQWVQFSQSNVAGAQESMRVSQQMREDMSLTRAQVRVSRGSPKGACVGVDKPWIWCCDPGQTGLSSSALSTTGFLNQKLLICPVSCRMSWTNSDGPQSLLCVSATTKRSRRGVSWSGRSGG